jgi:hypothetical protein
MCADGDVTGFGVSLSVGSTVGLAEGEADEMGDDSSASLAGALEVADSAALGIGAGDRRVAIASGAIELSGVIVYVGGGGVDFGDVPPKNFASTPPSSKPAKMTTRVSGKSGSPPPPPPAVPESSSERRRRGASLM